MSGQPSGRSSGRSSGRRRAVALGTGVAVAAGLALVAVDVGRAPVAAAADLAPFTSCDELLGWYRGSALAQVTAYGLPGIDGGGVAARAESAAADTAGPVPLAASAPGGTIELGGAVGSSGTGTNVQEQGVDEPSRIKVVDGRAYTLSGGRLVIVDVVAGSVLGDVEVGMGAGPDDPWYPSGELLLLEDRVVVFGSGVLPPPEPAPSSVEPLQEPSAAPPIESTMPSFDDGRWGQTATTTATTLDVTDPTAPVVLDRVEVEGSYVSARASGGAVRLVTTSTPALPFIDPWTDLRSSSWETGPDATDQAAALARNREIVQDATLDDWLPDLVTRDSSGEVTATSPVGCDTVAHPSTDAGVGTLSVLTLDPGAGPGAVLTGTTSVSAAGSVVYASTDRLYVATTAGGWWWGETGGSDGVTTQLHGFDTTDPRGTAWIGSGEVDGWLLGSWAMDAHEGHLRVGVTRESPVAEVQGDDPVGSSTGGADASSMPAPSTGVPATSASVVVLQETDDGLVQTGRVDGLGPGEQIRSLRWFDDLAVVVTFRQTDPLYTVDLADPAAPAVLGELKVTGYSGYLHPVGDGILLGVGQEGDEAGTMLGAKVETFDLADLAAPAQLDTRVWPQASSPVEWDSRLFAYLPEQRTAVLAIEQHTASQYETGVVALSVSPSGALSDVGHWFGDGWSQTSALATDGDRVLIVREGSEPVIQDGEFVSETMVSDLVVLDAGDLAVQHEVALG